jgi:hypothetical protein
VLIKAEGQKAGNLGGGKCEARKGEEKGGKDENMGMIRLYLFGIRLLLPL